MLSFNSYHTVIIFCFLSPSIEAAVIMPLHSHSLQLLSMTKSRFDSRTELFYKTDLLEKNSGSACDKTLGSAETPMRGDMSFRSISDSDDNACCVLQNPGPADDDDGISTQADDVPESEAIDQQSRIKLGAILGDTIRLLEDASKLKVGYIECDQSSSDMLLSNVKY